MPFNILVAVCLVYVMLLFGVAFFAERRARGGQLGWLGTPMVYTLSLSIYCTAWTFYGAVGYAARSGLEFVTIYLGPTLVFVGWWWGLRKLVRIGRAQRVTSIADLISSRYGKSNLLGVVVTLMAVAASTPYIALQLQSVTLSFGVFAAEMPMGRALPDQGAIAVWLAGGLALFTILFGTRNLDANERHHGVVMAIALEAVMKVVALLAVGAFVVWGMADGVGDVLDRISASDIAEWPLNPGRWGGLIFVSAAAVLTLPRMFQVLVVENVDERHLATASWAFPLYLMAMSLFVVPIAVVGLEVMPAGANPDLFVLTLPLREGQGGLALLAFLGGFSSATSMVIVASIALATMVSNHIVTPLWLSVNRRHAASRWSKAGRAARKAQRAKSESVTADRVAGSSVSAELLDTPRLGQAGGSGALAGDVRGLVLMSRRISIAAVLALGYFYFRLSGGSEALAAIGLIAFVGAAQVLPAMIGGIYWRGATHVGALAGLLAGFSIWLYCLFLPSFGESGVFSPAFLLHGPFGIDWLRPHALFGVHALDPLLATLFWSLMLNTTAFLVFSLVSFPDPMERLQGVAFVNVFDRSEGAGSWRRSLVAAEDLLSMAQRILGPDEAQRFFQAQAAGQGKAGYLPETTPEFLARLERHLAGSVGAATAHAMITQFTGEASVSVQDLIAVAGEAAEIKEYSAQLEAKSEELARTARALSEANEKLTALSVQKDGFLGQISHELRTPMTSIRAFSEILMEPDLDDAMRAQYAEIIHEEARRLTRLLDDLLDLSVLENRSAQLSIGVANLHDLLNRAVQSASNTRPERDLRLERNFPAEHLPVFTDTDRLVQVFINLISNARKYCDAERGVLRIDVRHRGDRVRIDFIDNGSGIPKASQAIIFEKFARLTDLSRAGGAGLGLAICREIMVNLGGTIDYLPGQGGAAFRVEFPQKRGLRQAG